jgi:hypothetical protein
MSYRTSAALTGTWTKRRGLRDWPTRRLSRTPAATTQYKQRPRQTEQQQLAVSQNDWLRRTGNDSSPEAATRLPKTAQRYRAAQTDPSHDGQRDGCSFRSGVCYSDCTC